MIGSEIAQLKLRIAEEYQSARLGLSGLAYGSSQHTFIEARLNHIGQYQERLVTLMGRDSGMAAVLEALDQAEQTAVNGGDHQHPERVSDDA